MFEHLSKDAVIVADEQMDKEGALRAIIERTCEVFGIPDRDSILSSIIDRESRLSTGIGLGIAVPHCRSDMVQHIVMAVMLIPSGVDYNSVDGQPVKLIFLIISPTHDVQGHIACLSTISHAVSDEETRSALLNAPNSEVLYGILDGIGSWQ